MGPLSKKKYKCIKNIKQKGSTWLLRKEDFKIKC